MQVKALIYSIGAKAEHIFKSFSFDNKGDSNKYSVVMVKKHLRDQLPGESVEAFFRQMYELAENYHFGAQKEEQMRDRIVIVIGDKLLS